jgi:hypothetical protein
MTKILQILLGLALIEGTTLTFLSPLVFSAPPQVPENAAALDTPARRALEKVRKDAWLNKRKPHPACPNCFKVEGELGIHETVPGTEFVITRDLPDPAPLEPGKSRDTVHPETGEPLWYKGNQAFVGPTDEEPWSTSLPIPLIQLKRIRYRHDAELRKIEGVHAIGIGEKGLLIEILPEKSANRALIPSTVEGVPVVVEETGPPIRTGHWLTYYRPVPVGAGITSTLPTAQYGTVGPHVSRDVSDIGFCCRLYTLTAGHVIQDTSLPMPTGRIIQQPSGYQYGFFGFMFRQTPCTGQTYLTCLAYASPVNDTRWVPDVAAIGHDTFDYYPMAPPCSGAEKPVRRMQHGTTSYVDGPTGIVRIPTMSNCSSINCLRTWGIYAHRGAGRLRSTEVFDAVKGPGGAQQYFYEGPLDTYYSTVSIQPGDSGALVAWDSSRDIIGLEFAAAYNLFGSFLYAAYQRLDYIQLAFQRAGVSFDHYWGTGNGKLNPSYLITDPLNPNPCSQ